MEQLYVVLDSAENRDALMWYDRYAVHKSVDDPKFFN